MQDSGYADAAEGRPDSRRVGREARGRQALPVGEPGRVHTQQALCKDGYARVAEAGAEGKVW